MARHDGTDQGFAHQVEQRLQHSVSVNNPARQRLGAKAFVGNAHVQHALQTNSGTTATISFGDCGSSAATNAGHGAAASISALLASFQLPAHATTLHAALKGRARPSALSFYLAPPRSAAIFIPHGYYAGFHSGQAANSCSLMGDLWKLN